MNRNLLSKSLTIFISSLLLLFPAFYNSYPFVFSDTGTYISSGFENIVPDDRPIFYGLLIRHTSLAVSLWYAILFQSLLVSFVLFDFVTLFIHKKKIQIVTFLALIFFLCLYSALPFLTSTLLPDIYTPIVFLLSLIILFKTKFTKKQYFFYSILFLYLSLTHLSNLISLSILSVTLILIKALCKNKILISTFRIKYFSILVFSLWFLLPLINSFFGYGFNRNKASHVFIMGKMVDNGMLSVYLKSDPEAKKYALYSFKDSLPTNAADFVWNPNSPLYKTGGWEKNKIEYDAIINDIIKSPKYWQYLIGISIIETLDQLAHNNFGIDFGAYKDGSPPYEQIKYHYKNDCRNYVMSRQFNSNIQIDFNSRSGLQNIYIAIGLCFIFVKLFLYGMQNKIALIGMISILFIVYNAFATGAISCVADRYNSRLSWIIIFIVSVYLLKFILFKLSKKYA